MQESRQWGALGVWKIPSYRERRRHDRSFGRDTRVTSWHCRLISKPKCLISKPNLAVLRRQEG